MADEASGTIPVELLSKWSGLTAEEIAKAVRGACKLVDGRYPATDAIRLTFAFMRQEMDYVSATELAELQSISNARVSTQATEGIIEQDGRGKYARRTTLAKLFAHYRQRLGETKTTASAAKNQTMALSNRLLEIQVAKAEGRAYDKEAVEKAWAGVILTIREKFLRLANKVAPQMPYQKTEAEAEKMIDTEVRECLSELSRPVEYEVENETQSERD